MFWRILADDIIVHPIIQSDIYELVDFDEGANIMIRL
jgi:hypothetical protein